VTRGESVLGVDSHSPCGRGKNWGGKELLMAWEFKRAKGQKRASKKQGSHSGGGRAKREITMTRGRIEENSEKRTMKREGLSQKFGGIPLRKKCVVRQVRVDGTRRFRALPWLKSNIAKVGKG